MISLLNCYKTDNQLTIVDRRIFDGDKNYFTDDVYSESPKEFALIYDAEKSSDYTPDTFKMPTETDTANENVFAAPFRDRILELMGSGYPLIFNALDYMGKPFGFICYYYRDYMITNYTNTMSVTNAIGTAIGGFTTIQYQQRILEKNEVLRENFNKNYFTKIDIRTERTIPLYSKSAKVLTPHPTSSYRLEADANKNYTLHILDPNQFWSTSKYLVIQVK